MASTKKVFLVPYCCCASWLTLDGWMVAASTAAVACLRSVRGPLLVLSQAVGATKQRLPSEPSHRRPFSSFAKLRFEAIMHQINLIAATSQSEYPIQYHSASLEF